MQFYKSFQNSYPTAHLGGSLGLYLRGIDLQRSLDDSDLDVTIDEFENAELEKDLVLASWGDFDYVIKKECKSAHINYYLKMDIRVNPEPSFDVINYKDVDYNVSKLRDIIFWKTKYAKKGIEKHIDDLETIKTGIRPIKETKLLERNNISDDLPF